METEVTAGIADRELRIGLVLNGGVSLAVWIGGVVHEIDALRRATRDVAAEPGGYAQALDAAGCARARVDVIAGASAGGINGALLAAAIQGNRPLRCEGRPLRDVWLRIGDLRALTRDVREPDPPSLLRGDEFFLEELERVLRGLLVAPGRSTLDHPLYAYLTATDLRGTRTISVPTATGTVREREHRVVFRFSARPIDGLGDEDDGMVEPADDDVLAETLTLNLGNARRLARAARASSSFPGAFPPHVARIERPGDPAGGLLTHLVDGGILDNQPFGPVLDRIAVMPVTHGRRRLLLYVVPSVSDVDASPEAQPDLLETLTAGGLARTLPKLESLERVAREAAAGDEATVRTRALLVAEDLEEIARRLMPIYLETRRTERLATVAAWAASAPVVGSGPLGRPEHVAVPEPAAARVGDASGTTLLDPLLPASGWDEVTMAWWAEGSWLWGFSAAERFARTALVSIGDGTDALARTARGAASDLAVAARRGASALHAAFQQRRARLPGEAPVETFARAHDDLGDRLAAVGDAFDRVTLALGELAGADAHAARTRLMAVEVVAHAAGTRPAPPPPFQFVQVSADRGAAEERTDVHLPPSERHPATSAADKLGGKRLGHFAAFLKASWRANDWMWGRLDAVAALGDALFADAPAAVRRDWVRARQVAILREELPAVARAAREDEIAGFSEGADVARWRRRHADLLAAVDADGLLVGDDEAVVAAFRGLVLDPDRVGEEAGSRAGVVTATGLATVASRAFSTESSGLPGPVRGIVGATRRAASLTHSLATTFARAPALGVAAVLVLAALTVVLATSEATAAAWLVPAGVALVVGGAWTTFGWLSRPPVPWRAAVLAAVTGALAAVNVAGAPPFEDVDAVGVVRLAVVLVAVGLLAVFARGCVDAEHAGAARDVRPALGLAFVGLVTTWLVPGAWDELARRTGEGTREGMRGWEEILADRAGLRLALIVFVAAVVVVPLAEALADLRERRRVGRSRP